MPRAARRGHSARRRARFPSHQAARTVRKADLARPVSGIIQGDFKQMLDLVAMVRQVAGVPDLISHMNPATSTPKAVMAPKADMPVERL